MSNMKADVFARHVWQCKAFMPQHSYGVVMLHKSPTPAHSILQLKWSLVQKV